MIQSIIKRCAGIDVHKSIAVCTILIEDSAGKIYKETQEYLTFRSELKGLAQWLVGHKIEYVAMESTGVYWKSVYETLEKAGLDLAVVNAYHVKNVPGRKTDVSKMRSFASKFYTV